MIVKEISYRQTSLFKNIVHRAVNYICLKPQSTIQSNQIPPGTEEADNVWLHARDGVVESGVIATDLSPNIKYNPNNT